MKSLCSGGFVYTSATTAAAGVDVGSSHSISKDDSNACSEEIATEYETNEIHGHVGLKRNSSSATDQDIGEKAPVSSHRNKRKRSGMR